MMGFTRHGIIDESTGEKAIAHEEVSYIVDDPYLVFTLGGRDIHVHPDEMITGRRLTVHMGEGEFREIRVLRPRRES